MRLSAPIYYLKRKAKMMSRAEAIPLQRAQDVVARAEGFQSWSHLAAAHDRHHDRHSPAARLYARLVPGDLAVLAARPGQGKTLLGLELAVTAAREGQSSHFFTLDYTDRDVAAQLDRMGFAGAVQQVIDIDTSDGICASYITAKLAAVPQPPFVIIDYLQLLDQTRSHPPLDMQLAHLRQMARETDAIIVAISQIDRAFESSGRKLPDWRDLRLPNPIDLSRFDKACFLHEGDMVVRDAA